MSVSRDGATVRLTGMCRVEDAEPLAAMLQQSGVETVDMSSCEGLHASVVQALLVFGPKLTGAAPNDFIRGHVAPALASARQASGGAV